MMSRFFLPLALLTLATPALADPRVEHLEYRADQIVRIVGVKSVQTMIAFAEDEHIENIAVGDAVAWQVTPNRRGNLLFVKPLLSGPATNMTVVTDRRRYLFELVAGKPGTRARYALEFSYPEPIRLVSTPPPAPAPEPVAPPPAPAPLNTQWQARGDKQMVPAKIYDDGTSTYIAWTATSDLPALLVQGTDGVEGPVNFTAKGDYLVVDGVARRYVLRIGKASAVLTNLAPIAAAPVPAPLPPILPGATSGDAP